MSLTKYRIDTNYIKFFWMKDDLGKTKSYSIPQNNKIKAKSTKSDFGDYLI